MAASAAGASSDGAASGVGVSAVTEVPESTGVSILAAGGGVSVVASVSAKTESGASIKENSSASAAVFLNGKFPVIRCMVLP
jgi:phosphoribosylformimino-5-aminoimidazole carboxamide ribonucleotide (ProFAR) isomerase